ncbi:MAG: M6 family metalloprotease domain-containing protein [Myxococcota bacterium]
MSNSSRLLLPLLLVGLAGCSGSKGTSDANAKKQGPAKPAAAAKPGVEPKAKPTTPEGTLVEALADLRFSELGNPVTNWDSAPSPRATKERPHQLLVVLVDFPDKHFDRFADTPEQGEQLADFYQQMLFDPTFERRDTLSHYYADQSGGKYHVLGKVLPPVTLSKPRAAYGAPHKPEGGEWRSDHDTEGMVEEALGQLGAAHPDLSWGDYDRWDPNDHDGDGELDEADGYIDHFVLIYAGAGQSSCQRLNELDKVLVQDATPKVLATLTPRQRECAERLWPHRFMIQRREGLGPDLPKGDNRRGGAPITETLWARDYNMQSEYTSIDTFVHEFGHSIGLPDVYAKKTTNSTGAWELMSSTASTSPQSLSAWSRMQLGWLEPTVLRHPSAGGEREAAVDLVALDGVTGADANRAAMVVLPPKRRTIALEPYPSGTLALYSGQGNEMRRTATLPVDFTEAPEGPLTLEFDAWWEIEAGWDFAYVEATTDDGVTWTRLLPTDRAHMPAKHGHDGKTTLPGFTGLSGDLDGDGKNESRSSCDPSQALPPADERVGKTLPCLQPSWVKVKFDLSSLRGTQAKIRLRYFTDMAAVMRGLVVDNVTVTGREGAFDFESDAESWVLDGFSRSPAKQELLVPHYYVLEYRDPTAASGEDRYDRTLARTSHRFFASPTDGTMRAMVRRPRPGVVLWYFDGEYAWSQNDPADNGPGKGSLLVVDANPNEIEVPEFSAWFQGSAAANDTRYAVADEDQAKLRAAFAKTVCFVRSPEYYPADFPPKGEPGCSGETPPARALLVDGKPLRYGYEIDDFLPGPERARWARAGEMFDQRAGKFRLRPSTFRYMQTQDAPFSHEPFPAAMEWFEVVDGALVKKGEVESAAKTRFDDGQPTMNEHLPFTSAAVPDLGFSFEVQAPGEGAPEGAKATVQVTWRK